MKKCLFSLCSFMLILSWGSVFAASPEISNINPIKGPTTGGTTVLINGQNFTNTTEVKFGSITASFFVLSDSLIAASAPAIQGGALSVDLTITANGTVTQPNAYTYTAPNWFAYPVGDGDMLGIDLATNQIAATIPVGPLSIGAAITPDGKLAYVASGDLEEVVVIDLTTNLTVATISTPNSDNERLAINAQGTRAYLAGGENNNLTVIDIASHSVITQISSLVPSGRIKDIAVSPDGTTGYSPDENNDVLVIFDLVHNAFVQAIDLTPVTPNGSPEACAITPDGTMVYITDQDSEVVSVAYHVPTSTLSAIPVPRSFGLDITSEPHTVFCTTVTSFPVTFVSLAILNTLTSAVETIPTSFRDAFDVAVTSDNKFAYMTIDIRPNVIQPFDLINKTTLPFISSPIGELATIVINPDQAPFALFKFTPSLAGSPSLFDASESFSPTGTIATYQWDFGDGSPVETTSSPTITHTYTTSGFFTVTLTVTNSAGTSTRVIFTGHTINNRGGPTAVSSQVIKVPSPRCPPSPPTDLSGCQKKQCCKILNIISWEAPHKGPEPVKYRIYKNSSLSDLIGVVKASDSHDGRFIFKDKTHDSFYIVSVDAKGRVSQPSAIFLLKECEKKKQCPRKHKQQHKR